MKYVIPIFLFLAISISANASTSITSPVISGHWTLAGAPYLINNTVTVNLGDTLTIDPGVEVIFQGNYVLCVEGSLIAVGTAAMPISFHINDTTGWHDVSITAGGWGGIFFGYALIPTVWRSTVEYCNVSDMKSGAFKGEYCNMVAKNCNFFHNNNSPVGGEVDATHTFEIANCSIHDNAGKAIRIYGYSGGKANIHDNQIYNNQGGDCTVFIVFTDLLFTSNNVYNNTTNGMSSGECAIYITDGNATIKHNTIHDNVSQFDAALMCVAGVFDINSNLICNNRHENGAMCGAVDGGGGLHVSSNSVNAGSNIFFNIRNNVIANNFSPFCGGGIKVYNSDASITNNQVVNNVGAYSGGIQLTCDTFSVVIKNNLLYGNETTNIPWPSNAVDHVKNLTYEHNWTQNIFSRDFSTIPGCYHLLGDTNTNVIGADPGMINPTTTADVTVSALGHDFRLMPGSQCIDRGDTTGAQSDVVDYDGYHRIYGSAIDIGAFEYGAHTGVSSIPVSNVSIEAFPNPASARLYLSTAEAEGSLSLTDITGKVVASQNVKSTITFFDIHSLDRGIYIATWCDGHGNKATQKVMVE